MSSRRVWIEDIRFSSVARSAKSLAQQRFSTNCSMCTAANSFSTNNFQPACSTRSASSVYSTVDFNHKGFQLFYGAD